MTNTPYYNNTKNMAKPPETIDLLELFFILLNKWKFLVLITFLSMGGFFAYAYNTVETKYQANIKMYVNADTISLGTSISLSDINASTSLVPIYSEILNTHLVLDKVGNKLADAGYEGFDYYVFTDNEMISTKALNDTPVFQISVTDTDPKRAIAIANTIASVLPDQIAGIIDGSSARIVDRAQSAERLSRGITKNTMIAGMIGFIWACGYILIKDYFLNDSITDSGWLTETFGDIPVLGRIPDARISNNSRYKYYKYGGYGKNSKLKADSAVKKNSNETKNNKEGGH